MASHGVPIAEFSPLGDLGATAIFGKGAARVKPTTWWGIDRTGDFTLQFLSFSTIIRIERRNCRE